MAESKQIIVYAEDDLDDLDLVRNAFKKYPGEYNLLHANNGEEALNLLKQLAEDKELPCLVILDINMPVLDGRETLMAIKKNEQLKNIPVIVFTTSSNKMDTAFAKKWGADFITKPIKYSDIEDLADEFLITCGIHKK